jgi:4-alpha-glucanotransferase
MVRGSGVLLGISSLPGKFGIGAMGSEARDFINMLAACGQKYWQILPLSPTGYGDSPYQSASAFAGNLYFIDPQDVYEQGLLTVDELAEYAEIFSGDPESVDYYLQFIYKEKMLKSAFARFRGQDDALRSFEEENAHWLFDYALYMAIKAGNGMQPFWEWPQALAMRDESALAAAREALDEEIRYHVFVQYLFFRQWHACKAYAAEKGIQIIGDMPIYIARDSADAWTHAEMLTKTGEQAGCPPDYFSPTGQLWGNPVYDWDQLKSTGYDWWLRRMRHSLHLYDYIRLDHFRGFEAYYAIPAGADTAAHGEWKKGPGMDFFEAIRQALGKLPIIAEDLGYLTPKVLALRDDTGFPGLKVLHFAFDPNGLSMYLPFRYNRNCVVYTGTHDNDTTAGWYAKLCVAEKAFVDEYLGCAEDIPWQLIRLAMGSVADVCILPMQDILGLPTDARMNTPQTSQGNWRWRLKEGLFSPDVAQKLKRLSALYGR